MSSMVEINRKHWHFLEHWNYQQTKARNELTGFTMVCSCETSERSIETLMEDIKPVITEKNESEDDSKLRAFFGHFGLPGFRFKGENN